MYNKIFFKVNKIKIIDFNKNSELQKMGVDKLIKCNNIVIAIEEKYRRKIYNDFLLELVFNDNKNTDGWLFYNKCHYLVYTFVAKLGVEGYILPMALLRKIFIGNEESWRNNYNIKKALNNGYNTLNTPIPKEVLLESLLKEVRKSNYINCKHKKVVYFKNYLVKYLYNGE